MSTEVRPGYKRTEVGVIPEEWEIVQIGDLKPFITSGSRGWASYYSERGSLFVRITNLSRERIYLNLDDCKFVSLPSDSSEVARTRLASGDLLISITADIGVIGYVDSDIPLPAYMNQHIALVRFDSSNTSGKFAAYFLASARPQRLFRALTDLGAKAGMSLLTVQKLHLAHPPIDEQRAIAKALSDVDALIDTQERLIAKKRDLKQAAMQQFLTGRTRLPGFEAQGAYKNTEVGTIPEDWDVVPIGAAGQVLGGRQRSPHAIGSPMKYLRVANVFDGFIDTSDVLEMPFTLQEKERFLLRPGDILLNEGQSTELVGRSAIYHGDPPDCCFQNTLIRYRANSMTCAGFAQLVFQRYLACGVFASIALQTTSIAHLGTARFAALKMPLPSLSEQAAIAQVLSDMDTGIAALEQRLAKIRSLKQGMMQELLTGRTRLV